MTAGKDLATFRRFLAPVASRHGQILNETDLAAPLGICVPTSTQWLGVLETTAQALIVPAFYEKPVRCSDWLKSPRRSGQASR